MNIYFLSSSRFSLAGKTLLCIVILFSACKPVVWDTEEHPVYFDSVFTRVDSIGNFDIKASHEYLERAYAAFPAPGELDRYRKYSYLHRYHIGRSRDLYLAMRYADSMLSVMDDRDLQQRNPFYYASALFAKGDVLRDQKKYNEAYTYFYRGSEALRQTHDTCQYHEYTSRLALVYYQQEKYLKAAPYFMETFRRLGDCDTSFSGFYLRQGMLDNVALSYDKAGKTDQALVFYDSALHFIRRNGAKYMHIPDYSRGIKAAIAVVYGNKGGALLRIGDTLGAEALFRQSIDINIRGQFEKVDAQLTMAKLIGLYLASNRLTDAGTVLQEMNASLEIMPNAGARQRWLERQWQYYEKKGQLAPAYATLKSYIKLRDSLTALTNGLSVVDINKEFERMAKEHQLEILQKNNKLKTAYLGILFFLFVTVIFITWMVWHNWRKSRRHIKELQRLNAEIITQHDHIRKSLTALEQSQQGHSRMMRIVAHDLRNPVGAIYSLSEMLLMKRKQEAAEDKDMELVELIKTSSTSALSLISDLLVLETSLTDMEKEPVEIHVSLKYCVDLLQMKAMEKRQHIILDAEPVKVLACREKIWRVFSNLINNAIKFSQDGATIEVMLKHVNGTARISVRDHGIGIPLQMQDKIFGQTTQAKRRGTRGEESFGFGLSISKQIIEAHDGRIWFETEDGKGTTFYVEMNTYNQDGILL